CPKDQLRSKLLAQPVNQRDRKIEQYLDLQGPQCAVYRPVRIGAKDPGQRWSQEIQKKKISPDIFDESMKKVPPRRHGTQRKQCEGCDNDDREVGRVDATDSLFKIRSERRRLRIAAVDQHSADYEKRPHRKCRRKINTESIESG